MNFFTRHEKKLIWGIVAATFLLSITYSFYFQIEPIVDARAYDNIAWDIAQGFGYDTDSAIGRPGPGYEIFLAGIYIVFGHSYRAVWFIQAILLAGTVYVVYKLARRIFTHEYSPIIGLTAATLVGFSPDLILISSMLMTETLFILVTVSAIYFFVRYIDIKTIQMIGLSALFLGFAVLIRSHVLFIILPLLGYFIYKKQWKSLLVFCIVFIVVLTPWTIRNYIVYDIFRPFNAGFTLIYIGNHDGATGELIPDYPLPQGYGDFSTMTQIEADTILKKEGIRYIVTHPLQFIKLTLWRASIYSSFARPFAFWPHLTGLAQALTVIISILYSVVIFTLGIAGGFLSVRLLPWEDKQKAVLVFATALMLPLSVIWLIVETRYRLSIYPMLAVFSGGALYFILQRPRDFMRELKSFIIITVMLFGNMLLDVVRNWERIKGRI
jgi:hypothetical protein